MYLADRLARMGEGADAGTGSASIAAEDAGFARAQRLKGVVPRLNGGPPPDLDDARRRELQESARLRADLMAASADASYCEAAPVGAACDAAAASAASGGLCRETLEEVRQKQTEELA